MGQKANELSRTELLMIPGLKALNLLLHLLRDKALAHRPRLFSLLFAQLAHEGLEHVGEARVTQVVTKPHRQGPPRTDDVLLSTV